MPFSSAFTNNFMFRYKFILDLHYILERLNMLYYKKLNNLIEPNFIFKSYILYYIITIITLYQSIVIIVATCEIQLVFGVSVMTGPIRCENTFWDLKQYRCTDQTGSTGNRLNYIDLNGKTLGTLDLCRWRQVSVGHKCHWTQVSLYMHKMNANQHFCLSNNAKILQKINLCS